MPDFETPDFTAPALSGGDFNIADMGATAPDLSTADALPDAAPIVDSTGIDPTGGGDATADPQNPFAVDSSQWDDETKNYAALGDLHTMIDDHVNTYGALPDENAMDGYMSQIDDRWGTPATPDQPDATDGGAMQAANDNVQDGGESMPSQTPDSPAPDAGADGGDSQIQAPENTDQTQTPQAKPGQPAKPAIAADTGSLSDAVNDIRTKETQNQLAQGKNTEDAKPPQIAMDWFDRNAARAIFPTVIENAKHTIADITGGRLSQDEIDNITEQVLENADKDNLKKLANAHPNSLTEEQFDIINREIGKLDGPAGDHARSAWAEAQKQGIVQKQKDQ